MVSKASLMSDVLAQYQQTKQRILSKGADGDRAEPSGFSHSSYVLPDYSNPALHSTSRAKSGSGTLRAERSPGVASPAFVKKSIPSTAFQQLAPSFAQGYSKQEFMKGRADAPGSGDNKVKSSTETQPGKDRRAEPIMTREEEWPGRAWEAQGLDDTALGPDIRVNLASSLPISRARASNKFRHAAAAAGGHGDGGHARHMYGGAMSPGGRSHDTMTGGYSGHGADRAVTRAGMTNLREDLGGTMPDIGARSTRADVVDVRADMGGERAEESAMAVAVARHHAPVESVFMTSLRCENEHLRDAFLDMKQQLQDVAAHARQIAEEKAQLASALEEAREAAARQEEQREALALAPPSPPYREQAASLRVMLADREDELRRAVSEVRRLESALVTSERMFSEREAALHSQGAHMASLLEWAHGAVGRLRDAVKRHQQQLFPTFQPSQELIQWVAAAAASGGPHGLSLEGCEGNDSKSLIRTASSTSAAHGLPAGSPDALTDALASTMRQLERSLALLCTVTDAKLEASGLVAARLRAEVSSLRAQAADAKAERDAAVRESEARASAERSEREELGGELGVLKQLFDAEVARLKAVADEAEQAAAAAREHAGGLEQRILQLESRMIELETELASAHASLERETAARRHAEEALPPLEMANQRLREELEGVQLAQKFGVGQKLHHGREIGRGTLLGLSTLGNVPGVQVGYAGQGGDARTPEDEVRKLMRMVDALVKENTELQKQSRKWAEGADNGDGAREGRESAAVKQSHVPPLSQRQRQLRVAMEGVSGAELSMVAEGTMSDSELMKKLLARKMLATAPAVK